MTMIKLILPLIISGAGKQTSSKNEIASRVKKPTIFWPLDHVNFRLVCRLCFLKEKEGIGGKFRVFSLKFYFILLENNTLSRNLKEIGSDMVINLMFDFMKFMLI